MTATAHDLTLAALAEVNPRAHAALAAAGPTGAGDPPMGALGFLSPGDLADLCRAADLAHRSLGHHLNDDAERGVWDHDDLDALVRYIERHGSWRRHPQHPAVLRAVTAYMAAILTEQEGADPCPD